MENYREYCNRLLGLPKNKKSILSEMRHTSLDSPILSPTAIPTPIIGGAVRGSVTGGLPSGADQFGDISPSRLGGYEKVDVNTVNSKLVDNTPKNPEIASPNPINQDPSLVGGVTHPHQVQKNAGEVPQNVTGASTDGDDSLMVKPNAPDGIDIEIDERGKPPPVGSHVVRELDETFRRHKKFMRKSLNLKECTCECGDPDCKCECMTDECMTDECKSCGCGKSKKNKMEENVGASEPFVTKWKMDPEKAGMIKVEEKETIKEAFERLNTLAGISPLKEKNKEKEVNEEELSETSDKYSPPFSRMRGLANIGEKRMMPDGTWTV